MKKKILILNIVIAGLLFKACTTDGENEDGDNFANLQATVEDIRETAISGPWTITNFVDSGKNETADFAGYGFSFNPDGSLIADNGSDTVSGSWSISVDDDDSTPESAADRSSDDGDDDDCNRCTVEQLTEVLTACSDWFVDKLERNEADLEDNFTGYLFHFSADGTLEVMAGSERFSGSWEASGSGNSIQVVLQISGLADFEDNWTLHEIELYEGESKVDFRINGEDRLRFKNNCTLGSFDGGNARGDIDFNIFFASPEDFAELSEDWDIISYAPDKIELIHVSGGDGETDLLTFEKN